MHPLQDKHRPISIGEAFIQDRDAGNDDKNATKVLIKQANSADIIVVLKKYGIIIDEYIRKCQCPFSFHNDKTPSFYYYKNTNSFYCFGCKHGGGSADFVALFENISKVDAATKIVSKFHVDPSILLDDTSDFISRQGLFIEFSELIRNFIFDNLDDKAALAYSEKVSLIFDTINLRHNLDNIGLKSFIDKLRVKLEQYKYQQL